MTTGGYPVPSYEPANRPGPTRSEVPMALAYVMVATLGMSVGMAFGAVILLVLIQMPAA